MVFIKGKEKIPAVILLVLMITLSAGCTANPVNSQSEALSAVIASSSPRESMASTPTSSETLAAESSTVTSTETKSAASIPVAEYPDWSTWTRPVERYDLISYDELLAKMPAITPNADASRFTAEDATVGGIGAGSTYEDIKRKLGDPVCTYKDILKETNSGILHYIYRYDGAYFIFFKGFTNNDWISFYPDENAEIVHMAVVYGEGCQRSSRNSNRRHF